MNSAGNKKDVAAPAVTNSPASPILTGNSANPQTNGLPVQPNTTNPAQTITTSNPTQATTTNNNSAGLNPEHGKPGHRCDISVGAPLNSAPNTTATPQVNTNTPVTTTVPANNKPQINPIVTNPTQAAGSSVKLNPAHGMPGHDCAIAVGQPLKN